MFQRADSTLGLNPGPSWTQTVNVRLVTGAVSRHEGAGAFAYPARVLTPGAVSVLPPDYPRSSGMATLATLHASAEPRDHLRVWVREGDTGAVMGGGDQAQRKLIVGGVG